MKVRWVIAIVAAVAAVVLLASNPSLRSALTGPPSAGNAAAQGGGACGPDAPAADLSFTMTDLDGKSVKFADYRGKVVLINFWATWCPPCKAEIPEFIEFRERFHEKGFEILGISVDDPQEALRPFADRYNVNYPLLVGADRDDVQEAYGPVFGVPQSLLVSRDGRICRKFIGPVSGASLERAVTPLL
jgi:peroxiredoxin